MSARITLTAINGPLKGAMRVFTERQLCVVGRAPDCDFQLTLEDHPQFANVSRRHCQLDVEPPMIRVRDLGSRNGTWLNGNKLESDGGYLENDSDPVPGNYFPMRDGDELRIGSNILRVRVAQLKEAPELTESAAGD